MPRFLDTNILIYAVSTDPAEETKRDRARALIDADDCALSVQVLQEFYVQITRPSRPRRLSHERALAFIFVWQRFPVQDMTVAILIRALTIKGRYGFSYWDGAIVAAAEELDCDILYTEDLKHDQQIGGVRIVDPFL